MSQGRDDDRTHLVISRAAGQKIWIDDKTWVEVRRVNGRRLTLVISAPRSVKIEREEVRARRLADTSRKPGDTPE